MGRNYDMETYKKFLRTSAGSDNDFGISDDTLIEWFMNQRGALAVINSYGVNRSNLRSTYIPKIREYGVSPVFFLMYTSTEGGGAGNWINHYLHDTGSDGLSCLIDDLKYVQSISCTWYPVALTAPECPYSYEDNAGACQAFYETCGDWSIANIIMPSTMAGNAWVWCYGWCSSNVSSRPPGCYFGNPYDTMISGIQAMGGTISGESISGGNNSNPGSPNNTTIEQVRADLKKAIEKLFEDNLHAKSPNIRSNGKIMLTRINETLEKPEISKETLQEILDVVKVPEPSTPPSGGDTGGGSTGGGVANENIQRALNQLQAEIGVVHGSGQCYALSGYYAKILTGWSCDYSVGGNILPLIGDGMNAHSLHQGWNWSVAGGRSANYHGSICPVSEIHAGDIFCIEAYQSYPTTGQWGHTGVILANDGATITTLEQNMNGNLSCQRYQWNASRFASAISGLVHFD